MNENANDLSNEIKEVYQLIVNCLSEEQLKKLHDKLVEEGFECQVLIL